MVFGRGSLRQVCLRILQRNGALTNTIFHNKGNNIVYIFKELTISQALCKAILTTFPYPHFRSEETEVQKIKQLAHERRS